MYILIYLHLSTAYGTVSTFYHYMEGGDHCNKFVIKSNHLAFMSLHGTVLYC
jgi:hypothetical protein